MKFKNIITISLWKFDDCKQFFGESWFLGYQAQEQLSSTKFIIFLKLDLKHDFLAYFYLT